MALTFWNVTAVLNCLERSDFTTLCFWPVLRWIWTISRKTGQKDWSLVCLLSSSRWGWAASLRHVMGFPHRGLLRKLRQPARHRSHAPLTSVADLPRFTCLDSGILRRLPVALFILACRKLAEVSNASVIDAAAPVFRIHVKTPSTGSAYVSLPVPPARPVRSRRPW